MIKAVIFDMDGLMIDTEILLQRFWIEAAEEFGFHMTKEQELGLRSFSSKYSSKYLERLFGRNFDYKKVRARRIELMNDYISKNGITPKKGLYELLDYLSEKPVKTCVCTATDFERTKKYLESINVFDKFDEFICGNMVGRGKPAPDIYEYACNKLGLEPCQCIALEDSPNGIISSAVAGLTPIMIPDLTQPSDDIKPLIYACCENLSEVIPIVNILCK